MTVTAFHAKYFPHGLTRQGSTCMDRLSMSLLLTATPLQNSLFELNRHSTLIDEHSFGDINSFRAHYPSPDGSPNTLRQRLRAFCKRIVQNEVKEHIRYSESQLQI